MEDSDSEEFDISDLHGQYVHNPDEDRPGELVDFAITRLDALGNEEGENVDNGSEDLKKAKIEAMIQKASEGMEYQKTELKRQAAAQNKLAKYKAKIEETQKDEEAWDDFCHDVQNKVDEIRKEMDVSRTWMHLAVDWFFSSIEEKNSPELKGKPIATIDKNVVTHVNRLASEFGVRKGIPSFVGKKICPLLVMVKPNTVAYRKYSDWLKNICKEYDNSTEVGNLDDMSMDITDYLKTHNLDSEMGRKFIAKRIQNDVAKKLGFTCSIGIGCNSLLAKICCYKKRMGEVTVLPNDIKQISEFMRDLPVKNIPGVGQSNFIILSGLGIIKCSHVIEKAAEILTSLTENFFESIIRSALGVGKNIHEDQTKVTQKSVSVCATFKCISEMDEFKEKILMLSKELGQKCELSKLVGRSLTLELKTTKFHLLRKTTTLNKFISKQEDFVIYGMEILNKMWPIDPVRQISLKLTNLEFEDECAKKLCSGDGEIIGRKRGIKKKESFPQRDQENIIGALEKSSQSMKERKKENIEDEEAKIENVKPITKKCLLSDKTNENIIKKGRHSKKSDQVGISSFFKRPPPKTM